MVNVVYFYCKEKNAQIDGVSYLEQLMISVRSLINHASLYQYSVSVYVSPDTDTDTIEKIECKSTHTVSVKCHIIQNYDPKVRLGSGANPGKLYALKAAAQDIEKFLYLDLDTVILSDIADCYNIDIGEYTIGGVIDFGRVFLDRKEELGYIQGGLYLVNSSKLLPHLENVSELVSFGDDEIAINRVVSEKKLLPLEWNTTPHMLAVLGEQQVCSAKILHFAGHRDFIHRNILRSFPRFCEKMYAAGYIRQDSVNIAYMYRDDGSQSHGTFVSTFDQLCISIESILTTSSSKRKYSISIFIDNIEEVADSKLNKLTEFRNDFVEVTCIGVPKHNLFGLRSGSAPDLIYGLICASNTYDRFLFLDADTIVVSDISELFDYDIGNCSVGGCITSVCFTNPERRPNRQWIQGGCYLINSKKFKEVINQSTAEHLINTMRNEENIINLAFNSKCILPFEWNFTGGYLSFLGEDQIFSAKLIHITGIKDLSMNSDMQAHPIFKKFVLEHGYSRFIRLRRVILERRYDALGDVILFGDVINTLRKYFPWIYIDVTGSERLKQILKCMGCDVEYVDQLVDRKRYDKNCWHVVYDNPEKNRGVHILTSMFINVLKELGLSGSNITSISLSPCVVPSTITVPNDYVLVCSKEPQKPGSEDKYYSEMEKLVELLSERFNIIELNTLSSVKTFEHTHSVIHTDSLPDTAKLFKHARFSVLIENGMNHWACHNGGKTYCLFIGEHRASPNELYYPTMTPIPCYDNKSPEYVFSVIKEHENQ